uniref:Uncharacterized protein n=1 Tax=Akashiwo sanguinea TaxID=143672 RepID=A0A7S2QWJ9_9DINO|mmetsp:Transcript_1583/g.965  ORF Transcript_1583/g.965 Transcript_1583/m.965 type:complete len:120 (+) Transcript_1583:92-451(+)
MCVQSPEPCGSLLLSPSLLHAALRLRGGMQPSTVMPLRSERSVAILAQAILAQVHRRAQVRAALGGGLVESVGYGTACVRRVRGHVVPLWFRRPCCFRPFACAGACSPPLSCRYVASGP